MLSGHHGLAPVAENRLLMELVLVAFMMVFPGVASVIAWKENKVPVSEVAQSSARSGSEQMDIQITVRVKCRFTASLGANRI
jgi:hypothetical protein